MKHISTSHRPLGDLMSLLNWARAAVRVSGVGCVAALAAVTLVSVVIWVLVGRTHIASISMVYLTVVLATAVAFGRGPAILAAVAAFLTFDFFFTEPYYTFTVTDPEEWVALLLFLTAAVITGQLAAGQRQRALEAMQREREAVVLYDVVRLLNEPDLRRALDAVAERLRQELQLTAVGIDLAFDSEAAMSAMAGEAGGVRTLRDAAGECSFILGEGQAPTEARRGAPGRWLRVVPPGPVGAARSAGRDRLHVVPIRVGDHRVGSLALARPSGATPFTAVDDRLLSAVGTQLGLAVERARLRREATETEVLRRTDELKTALLNAVSHDLRTPLASIVASAGSLRQEDVAWTEQERRDYAEAIEEEAQRLNRIVGNLLDLSRIEGGHLRPEKGWYDVGELVDHVVGRLRAATAGHRVTTDVPDDLPPVLLDYVQIDQVLSNLLENAVRHTRAGTAITIAVRQHEGIMRFALMDEGAGIPPAALSLLFTPFCRIDGRGGPNATGQGLGLAVAKGLVEAHGGRIWAENRPGGGACFVFTLPAGSVPESVGPAGRESA